MYLLYGVAQRWVPLNSRVVAILWDAVEDAVEDADSRPPLAPDLVTFRTVVSSTTRDGFLSFRLRLGASAPVWSWWVGGREGSCSKLTYEQGFVTINVVWSLRVDGGRSRCPFSAANINAVLPL